jgi:hypothetical protein
VKSGLCLISGVSETISFGLVRCVGIGLCDILLVYAPSLYVPGDGSRYNSLKVFPDSLSLVEKFGVLLECDILVKFVAGMFASVISVFIGVGIGGLSIE